MLYFAQKAGSDAQSHVFLGSADWRDPVKRNHTLTNQAKVGLLGRLHAGDHVLVGGALVSNIYEREIG